jgi:hypothetical protein
MSPRVDITLNSIDPCLIDSLTSVKPTGVQTRLNSDKDIAVWASSEHTNRSLDGWGCTHTNGMCFRESAGRVVPDRPACLSPPFNASGGSRIRPSQCHINEHGLSVKHVFNYEMPKQLGKAKQLKLPTYRKGSSRRRRRARCRGAPASPSPWTGTSAPRRGPERRSIW